MKDNVFEKEIKIRYSEMDYNLMLKPSALLCFLQDLASENAENLNFGYSFISKNNLAWFLLKYHMEFENYPINIYDLTFKTEPRGYNKLFAMRDFEIWDDNRFFGRVSSTWALVDINSKSIVPVNQAIIENPNMIPFEKRESDLIYEKIKPLNRIDCEKVFEIRYEDIDVNLHANNSNYVIWAFELLDIDFRKQKRLKTLDINFKKEIKFGSKIISQAEIEGNRTCHIIKCVETGEDLCLISALWTEK